MYNPFRGLKRKEWVLYIVSLIIAGGSNLLVPDISFVATAATLVGMTALILLARGDTWGQIMVVVFSFLYGIESLQFHYYGELVTYLGMTMPIAALSVYQWVTHPYEEAEHEVAAQKMTPKLLGIGVVLAVVITVAFYFILGYLNTPNLIISTLSVTTSVLASYLMYIRNKYYAIAYASNDVILVILWILASIEDLNYLPMVFNFIMFLANDIYGYVCWMKREREQINE
ncbi:MAG: nicotinamide mononucleotide transporter [Eubacterium sp.]|nr:nicotinamide mononucleotide transporter [Candidatus Colimonas fimequi]